MADTSSLCSRWSLQGLECYSTDIGNAFLESTTREKVTIISGEEFEDLEGRDLRDFANRHRQPINCDCFEFARTNNTDGVGLPYFRFVRSMID